MCHREKQSLYVDTDKFIDECLFAWTDCTNIHVKQNLLNELNSKSKKYKNLPSLLECGYLGKNTTEKLERLKNGMKN